MSVYPSLMQMKMVLKAMKICPSTRLLTSGTEEKFIVLNGIFVFLLLFD